MSVTRTRRGSAAAGKAATPPAPATAGSMMAAALVAARALLGGIFLLAGASKVGDPGAFAAAVRAYHLLPAGAVAPFALILPWLEVLAAVYLVTGFIARIGAAGAGLMLGMFVVALGDALLTGNTAHACGCFGGTPNGLVALLAGGNTIGWWDVIRDLILLALAGLIVVRGPGPWSADGLMRAERRR